MGTDNIAEILNGPLAETIRVAELLQIVRLKGELEDTFRTRVAYGYQARQYKEEGKAMPLYMQNRQEEWEERARLEASCDPPLQENGVKVLFHKPKADRLYEAVFGVQE